VKKAVITGPGQAAVTDMPRLQARDRWVVVRVRVAPMCAEYKRFIAGEPAQHVGHEAAGDVVAVDRPALVRSGDRVVALPLYSCGRCAPCLAGEYLLCDKDSTALFTGADGSAAMAQYLLKPDWLLVPIPEQVSYEHAAMACCGLGATFGAMDRLTVGAFDTVLITGLGPVGLGGVINARYRGARVIGVDPNPVRAELARRLGADLVIDPADGQALAAVLEATAGSGAGKAVECSGDLAAQRLCLDATRRGGAVAFVGESNDRTPIQVSPDLLRKCLTVIGCWQYNLNAAPRLMRQIAALGPALDTLITHTFPLEEIQQAWQLQASGRCGKIILRP
jgi:L-iditol 2-dehydrogenase